MCVRLCACVCLQCVYLFVTLFDDSCLCAARMWRGVAASSVSKACVRRCVVLFECVVYRVCL